MTRFAATVLPAALVLGAVAGATYWYFSTPSQVASDSNQVALRTPPANQSDLTSNSQKDATTSVASSLPQAAQPVRNAPPPKPRTVDWKHINAGSLMDALQSARGATRIEEAEVALRASSICLASNSWSVDFLTTTARPSDNSLLASAAVVREKKEKLDRICAPVKTAEAEAAMRDARNASRSVSSPAVHLVGAGAANQTQWSQERRQAAIGVLSDPERLGHLLDYALDSISPNRISAEGLSEAEMALARSLAYQELTDDKSPDSIRNLFFCIKTRICDTSATTVNSSDSGKRAQVASAELVRLIKSQSWEQLGF